MVKKLKTLIRTPFLKKWTPPLLSLLMLFVALNIFMGVKDHNGFEMSLRSPASAESCLMTNVSCRHDTSCCSKNCLDGYCAKHPKSEGQIGERCESYADCISLLCNEKGKCAGSGRHLGFPGDYCENNYECKSNICDSSVNKCLGTEAFPAQVGDYCKNSHYECLSRNCNQRVHLCFGSNLDYAKRNEVCAENFECERNFCNQNKHLCQ